MSFIEEPTEEPEITYHLPINKWNESDRPREKLIRLGASVLSDAELIALIFSTGIKTKKGSFSAIQLAQALLNRYGSLTQVSKRELKEITQVLGIGMAKATQLLAAFEIGRRIESQQEGERIQITSPDDVAQLYGPQMRDLNKEIFKVVLLNTANVVIKDYDASVGGLASSIVEPRSVFKQAILENAASVICLHNHPSGNLEPSREDIKITKQLVEIGKLMGIPLHDHLIIAGRSYTSLAERGLV